MSTRPATPLPPMTREAIEAAAEKYRRYCEGEPQQFNINLIEDYEGQPLEWEAEFCEESSKWSEGFTLWMSDDEAEELYRTLDPAPVNATPLEYALTPDQAERYGYEV